MAPTVARWSRFPRVLAEDLRPLDEPLGALLRPGQRASPGAVARRAALALLDLAPEGLALLAPWLAPHQVPAARRLVAIVRRWGGAVLADAVGLGKSYVALGVARALAEPFALVVPAVLAPQWRDLLGRLDLRAPILTHESLSRGRGRRDRGRAERLLATLVIVDEAHRFRNPETRRYRALARLTIGRRLLLVSATPVHNRLADLLHALRLFLRDDALTALGLPSLGAAARRSTDTPGLRAAVARLVVARSRERVRVRGGLPALRFPRRPPGTVVRAGPGPDQTLDELATAVGELRLGDRAPALVRLLLYSRLASSLPAFRATLARLDAFAAAAEEAALHGRALGPREFARWFPLAESGDVQLALTPLLLEAGPRAGGLPDRGALAALLERARDVPDPKAATLDQLLAAAPVKTIVFTAARATARHLAHVLRRRHRVAVLAGAGGVWGGERVKRADVLRAFAPAAMGSAPPPAALTTDVLVATDLLSEGLNLQDAARVVHYDLPWSPARLAQRVGRIDRLGSPHTRVETVSFLPPQTLASALELEGRLARKSALQRAAGAAALETPDGAGSVGILDWCDRLQALAEEAPASTHQGAWAAVRGPQAAVLVVQFGGATSAVEAIVVDQEGCRPDAERATGLLEAAASATDAVHATAACVTDAVTRAAGVVRERLCALEAARWRAADRDGPGRRLAPWALAAARRAARQGNARRLARVDALVARLTRGLTAGEELTLRDLLERRGPLAVGDVLRWHERLPPLAPEPPVPGVELVAAVVFR